jgi:hypothetical protein
MNLSVVNILNIPKYVLKKIKNDYNQNLNTYQALAIET